MRAHGYPRGSLLLVDDDPVFRMQVRESLLGSFDLKEAGSDDEFWRLYAPNKYDLLLLDVRLRVDREGLDLLRELRAYDDLQPVVMVSAFADTETAIDAIAHGALMYLDKKEFSPGLILKLIEALLEQGHMRRRLATVERRVHSETVGEFIGKGPAIASVREKIREATTDSRSVVTIVGEPGTGRLLAARHIHSLSQTRNIGPFVQYPDDAQDARKLLSDVWRRESVGSAARRRGVLEEANGGILVLKSSSAVLSPAFLNDTLTSIVGAQLEVPGLSQYTPLDCQLVAIGVPQDRIADHIAAALQRNSFSARLIEIAMPPLRERKPDVPVLAAHFLQMLQAHSAKLPRVVSVEALRLLETYDWPGNVRELKVVLECAALSAAFSEHNEITPAHFPDHIRANGRQPCKSFPTNYAYEIARTEVELVENALAEFGRLPKAELFQLLGYHDRFIFQRRIKRHLSEHRSLAVEFKHTSALFGMQRL